MKRQNGFTLIEVLIAFLILCALMLSGGVMARRAGDLVRKGNEKMIFLQEVMFAYSFLEKGAGVAPIAGVFPELDWQGGGASRFVVVRLSDEVRYRYYPATQTLALWNSITSVESIISQGILWPDMRPVTGVTTETCLNTTTGMTAAACGAGQPVFELTDNTVGLAVGGKQKMLRVHFRSEREAEEGRRGLTKTILLSNWCTPP